MSHNYVYYETHDFIESNRDVKITLKYYYMSYSVITIQFIFSYYAKYTVQHCSFGTQNYLGL